MYQKNRWENFGKKSGKRESKKIGGKKMEKILKKRGWVIKNYEKKTEKS
jgi:hypothetical protein